MRACERAFEHVYVFGLLYKPCAAHHKYRRKELHTKQSIYRHTHSREHLPHTAPMNRCQRRRHRGLGWQMGGTRTSWFVRLTSLNSKQWVVCVAAAAYASCVRVIRLSIECFSFRAAAVVGQVGSLRWAVCWGIGRWCHSAWFRDHMEHDLGVVNELVHCCCISTSTDVNDITNKGVLHGLCKAASA